MAAELDRAMKITAEFLWLSSPRSPRCVPLLPSQIIDEVVRIMDGFAKNDGVLLQV